MMKNEKGVTLMALMVTVIVLFILSGIALNYSVSNQKDFKDNKLEIELLTVRQAVAEQYEKAKALNRLEKKTDDEIWVGTRVSDISKVERPDGKDFLLSKFEYPEDYYYRLTKKKGEFEKLGISNVSNTYIVNYKTKEVYNETRQTYYGTDEILYLPPIQENEIETNDYDFNDWEDN